MYNTRLKEDRYGQFYDLKSYLFTSKAKIMAEEEIQEICCYGEYIASAETKRAALIGLGNKCLFLTNIFFSY